MLLVAAAGLWNERREELGWPMGTIPVLPEPEVPYATTQGPSAPADFVLEIGCEELPPEDVDAAVQQLRSEVIHGCCPLAEGHCSGSFGSWNTGMVHFCHRND